MVNNHLSLLEERVEGLIQHLDRTVRANEELRRRNGELEEELEGSRGQLSTLQQELHRLGRELEGARAELAQARQETAGLHADAQKLRVELESTAGREDLVRERLQGILEKIDSIEQELNVMPRAE